MTPTSFSGGSVSQPSETTPSTSVDWTAYERLQERHREADRRFDRRANEYGLTKLLEGPDRKVSGGRLAYDLYRDGKRVVQNRNEKTVRGLDERQPAQRERLCRWPEQAERAIGILRMAFRGLSARHRKALRLDVRKDTNEETIRAELSVGPRQLRNIAREAREELWADNLVREAYLTLIDNVGANAVPIRKLILELLLQGGEA